MSGTHEGPDAERRAERATVQGLLAELAAHGFVLAVAGGAVRLLDASPLSMADALADPERLLRQRRTPVEEAEGIPEALRRRCVDSADLLLRWECVDCGYVRADVLVSVDGEGMCGECRARAAAGFLPQRTVSAMAGAVARLNLDHFDVDGFETAAEWMNEWAHHNRQQAAELEQGRLTLVGFDDDRQPVFERAGG